MLCHIIQSKTACRIADVFLTKPLVNMEEMAKMTQLWPTANVVSPVIHMERPRFHSRDTHQVSHRALQMTTAWPTSNVGRPRKMVVRMSASRHHFQRTDL
jgi:hypothetical protein